MYSQQINRYLYFFWRQNYMIINCLEGSSHKMGSFIEYLDECAEWRRQLTVNQ